ncbi:hypothetical protein H9P43_002048 [Blastocladiella emersonii ATCC 22665]|nr:hypothetical protein H9P43_002048 [Blastocladiella emersonii ATCC 22665]
MKRVRALYDFTATDDDQLSVREGQEFVVIHRRGLWYYVSTNASTPFGRDVKTGLVPTNYLEVIDDDGNEVDYYDDQDSGISAAATKQQQQRQPASRSTTSTFSDDSVYDGDSYSRSRQRAPQQQPQRQRSPYRSPSVARSQRSYTSDDYRSPMSPTAARERERQRDRTRHLDDDGAPPPRRRSSLRDSASTASLRRQRVSSPSRPSAKPAPPRSTGGGRPTIDDSDITLLATVLEATTGGSLLLAAERDDVLTILEINARRGMVRGRNARGDEGLIRWAKLQVFEMGSGTVIAEIEEAVELLEMAADNGPPPLPPPAAPRRRPSPSPVRSPVRAPASDRRRYNDDEDSDDDGYGRGRAPQQPLRQPAPRRASPAYDDRDRDDDRRRPNARSPSPGAARSLGRSPSVGRGRYATSPRMASDPRAVSPGPGPARSLGRSPSLNRTAPARMGPNSPMLRPPSPGGSMTLGRVNSPAPNRTVQRSASPGPQSMTLGRAGGTLGRSLAGVEGGGNALELIPRSATLTRAVPSNMIDHTESYSSLRRRNQAVDALAYDAKAMAGTGGSGGGGGGIVADLTLSGGNKVGPATYSYTLQVSTKARGTITVTRTDAQFYALVESWADRLPSGAPLPALPPALTVGAEMNYKQCMVLPAVVAQRQREFAAFCKRLVAVQELMGGAELVAEFLGLGAPPAAAAAAPQAAMSMPRSMGRMAGGGGGGPATMGRRPSAPIINPAGYLQTSLEGSSLPTSRVAVRR